MHDHESHKRNSMNKSSGSSLSGDPDPLMGAGMRSDDKVQLGGLEKESGFRLPRSSCPLDCPLHPFWKAPAKNHHGPDPGSSP